MSQDIYVSPTGGYKRIRLKGHHRADQYGRVREHNVVWERENNACLLWWADVDHIDKNKLNNHPSNLRAMMHGQHTKRHHIGAKRSPETCRRISESKKGKHPSPESNKKRSESLKGRTFSDEHRRKIGEANKKRGKPIRDYHGRYIRFCRS